MRVVYQAENIVDAHLVKNALDHAGIHAFVAGEYLTGAIGELPVMGLVAVMVDDADVEAARSIAGEIDAALRDNRANPGTFDPLPDPA
ncbi:MAG TPA: DUF2007 domain-containing protein [Tahibacter sp.]|jgi:hypothetical protein|nr:DUF2007 domain-containing protein [Tahibacter sp.]